MASVRLSLLRLHPATPESKDRSPSAAGSKHVTCKHDHIEDLPRARRKACENPEPTQPNRIAEAPLWPLFRAASLTRELRRGAGSGAPEPVRKCSKTAPNRLCLDPRLGGRSDDALGRSMAHSARTMSSTDDARLGRRCDDGDGGGDSKFEGTALGAAGLGRQIRGATVDQTYCGDERGG